MTIAREGWSIIFGLLFIGVFVFTAGVYWAQAVAQWLGAVLILLGLFSTFFFRDPERTVLQDPRLIVSPADGKVVRIQPAADGHELGAGTMQMSIFLSVFDVHINRAPIAGRVATVAYRKGRFLAAFDDKASEDNEQNVIVIEEGRTRIMFKQIAGIIARRIVFTKRVDERVERGERVGLIKFGSRVDVFFPAGVEIKVKVGDHVQGGVSVLGMFP